MAEGTGLLNLRIRKDTDGSNPSHSAGGRMPLKTIKVKEYNQEFYNDSNRIQRVLIDKGYYADNSQCRRLWELVSEEYAASWLELPKTDQEIYESIRPHFEDGI